MVEGARLESEYTAKPYRGFESLPLRHFYCANTRSRFLTRSRSERLETIYSSTALILVMETGGLVEHSALGTLDL